MIKTLVIVEHDNQAIQPDTLHALGAALSLQGDVDLLVAGYNCQNLGQEASQFGGVRTVWVADFTSYEHLLAEPIASLVQELCQKNQYTHVIASANAFGKNILPRIAALLDVAAFTDVVAILSEKVFKRPIYAGSLIETVQSKNPIQVLSVRSAAFGKAVMGNGASSVKRLQKPADTFGFLAKYLEQKMILTTQADLATAKVVVAGGKGLGSREQFEALLGPLAKLLGAAIGATRSAVDAGYVANACQVGQTGKIVAPEVYMAVGISGAIQHLTGIKDSKVIVAINHNKDEPIFQVADYGLVGDLFEIVPALYQALSRL